MANERGDDASDEDEEKSGKLDKVVDVVLELLSLI